jgi:hypothetical protein
MEIDKPDPEKSISLLRRVKQIGSKYKGEIGLSFLVVYVFLLSLGTVGEVWSIEWILDLPIFRPPGKY